MWLNVRYVEIFWILWLCKVISNKHLENILIGVTQFRKLSQLFLRLFLILWFMLLLVGGCVELHSLDYTRQMEDSLILGLGRFHNSVIDYLLILVPMRVFVFVLISIIKILTIVVIAMFGQNALFF